MRKIQEDVTQRLGNYSENDNEAVEVELFDAIGAASL